jgi:hypothetical protein
LSADEAGQGQAVAWIIMAAIGIALALIVWALARFGPPP